MHAPCSINTRSEKRLNGIKKHGAITTDKTFNLLIHHLNIMMEVHIRHFDSLLTVL